MSSSGTKYSWASNIRPTSTMPLTRPLKMASLASMPVLSASFAASLAVSSSYWITAFRNFSSSSFFFSSVAIGLPPVISDFIHHRLEIIGRHRGPDVAPGPDRAYAVVHALLYRLPDELRISRDQHVVRVVVAEHKTFRPDLLARLGHVVLLIHADRPGAAFDHERDDIVRLAADVQHARHRQLLEDPFQIRQDQGLEHPRREHIGSGAHLADRDIVHAGLFVCAGNLYDHVGQL